MAFVFKAGGGGFRFQVRGGTGPRLRITTTTSAISAGAGVAGRGLRGPSSTNRVSTLISSVSRSGEAFAASPIVSGGSSRRPTGFAEF